MNNCDYAMKIADALRHEYINDITRPFGTNTPVEKLQELEDAIRDQIVPPARPDGDYTVTPEGLEIAGRVHSSLMPGWELSKDGHKWQRA